MALDLESIGKKIGPFEKAYTWKDVVLYALGVGAGFDELEYCYENQLKVLPSFSIGSVFEFLANAAINSGANLSRVLHGEQDIIFHHPIPTEGTLTTEGAITHMYDRGPDRGALVVAEADTYHSNGERLFTNIFTLFCRLDGGFGGKAPPKEVVELPQTDPDFEEEAFPSLDQPLLYRMSGDIYKLHVDPDFAQASGFEKPIMHGLCTHGFACRAVIKHLFPGEPERMTRFRLRFSRPLYPGVPIKTQIWKMEEDKALFRTINSETGEVVLDRGIVEWLSPEEMGKRAARKGIRFDDQVAIVTGAGAGLGKVYALELAKRGAKVVVNDLGGARDGSGEGSSSPADQVVEEIKALGGEAVASYDSVATVEGGEAIVNKAMESFGRVDILINNAGILRDRSFGKMSPEDWGQVLFVHLFGAYNVTRPAFLKMREGGYGRIVMTTSAAGLFGNYGQTNYSAAKMGLVGLMNTLKLEGEKYDIKVNTVSPIAATRLTEDVLPPDLFEKLQPEFVTPLVLYLCSRDCGETGMIFNAGMGYFNRAAVVSGPGAVVGDGKVAPTVEEIHRNWDSIHELSGAKEYYNATVAFGPLIDALRPEAETAAAAEGLTVKTIFDRLPEAFQADKAAGVDVVFQFKISGPDGGDWYARVKDGTCEVNEGVHESPTTTIIMSDSDFVGLIEGTVNAMQAYTSGKLKIEGDLMKSQLIEKLFEF
ncbi:MAG: SDR family NAD(P)-dependent oxidoreductase [Deltaproteobacteria bacterium]|nr:MAG: SDR family NAD(P)-dependent oxidoreductase [Deltaproteobacteria bacterium]